MPDRHIVSTVSNCHTNNSTYGTADAIKIQNTVKKTVLSNANQMENIFRLARLEMRFKLFKFIEAILRCEAVDLISVAQNHDVQPSTASWPSSCYAVLTTSCSNRFPQLL
jgi:hypothetical protein